jgi:outer membrane protein TolC
MPFVLILSSSSGNRPGWPKFGWLIAHSPGGVATTHYWLALTAVFVLAVKGEELSLQKAVDTALDHHPAARASAAGKEAASLRIKQARGGFLPRVGYAESYQRSDNPVFVFGSLLAQHQFTEQNFQIGPLNRPDFLNNFQSVVTADQVLYDGGATRSQLHGAELGHQMAAEEERRTRMGLIAHAVGAYFGAVLAKEQWSVATESVKSAEADLRQAETIRDAGKSTDADVLSVRVHLAAMREQEIRARNGVEVSSAALNEALGLDLDTAHDLTTALAQGQVETAPVTEFQNRATGARPELRQADLATRVVATQAASAKAAMLPQVGLRGAFEADRQQFVTRSGANWLLGVTLRWNLFNGFSDQARREESTQSLVAARANAQRADSEVHLEVRKAYAGKKAAEERIAVAAAAVELAEESLRINRNRYEAGLATVTELLRNETALLETRARRLEAVYAQRMAAVELELAAGTLSGDSDVLK